jgi:hypothetical protein
MSVDLGTAYLSAEVSAEPLVDGWPAWPHLLSPVTQALNLQFRYLQLAQSFAMTPTVHVAANADPAMFGGPFVDLREDEAEGVQAYLEDIQVRRQTALGFAQAVRAFDGQLQTATGYSLHAYRDKVPPELRGLIDVAYDLNNHPILRVKEEMFEEHDLGHGAAQELLLTRQIPSRRQFFLNTPRISPDLGLRLATPFASPIAKAILGSRLSAIDLRQVAPELGLEPDDLAPFFTHRPSDFAAPYAGDRVRVRYFGHAALLVESAAGSILIDPTFATERIEGASHLTVDDLPRQIDLLFLSHGHHDHFNPEAILRIRDRVQMVAVPPNNAGELADPSLARMLRRLGFDSIRTISPLETIEVPGGFLTALPFSGEHSDLDVHSKHCALLQVQGRRIGVFVDSDAIDIDVYMRLLPRLQNIDLMFIGMECFGAPLSWLYGPLIPGPLSRKNDNSRRLSGANADAARRLTAALRPSQAYVYAMGQEPWMRHLMGLQYSEDSIQLSESSAFVTWCHENGIAAEHLHFSKEIEL